MTRGWRRWGVRHEHQEPQSARVAQRPAAEHWVVAGESAREHKSTPLVGRQVLELLGLG
jgi:hypothetical protein